MSWIGQVFAGICILLVIEGMFGCVTDIIEAITKAVVAMRYREPK